MNIIDSFVGSMFGAALGNYLWWLYQKRRAKRCADNLVDTILNDESGRLRTENEFLRKTIRQRAQRREEKKN